MTRFSRGDSPAERMRRAATALLGEVHGEQRALAARPFPDDAARRWLEYRPEPRPGARIADLGVAGRKAAHRLLGSGLSDHAFAQAMAIVALEEVLDRREHGSNRRHSGDYWVAVFGDPTDDAPWGWRFEGHHLSVTMTVAGDAVSPAPVFLGANPARVTYAGRTVSRPLAPEEDLARAFVDALTSAERAQAIVSDDAPLDIRTGTRSRVDAVIEPRGLAAGRVGPTARAVLSQIVALYLDRLPRELAGQEAARVGAGELHFAWEGTTIPGRPHYYRIHGDDLLIEYDATTEDGNHQHTVLRRPRSDFGDDLLARHHVQAHA